jgi:hypothetical protein
MVRSDTWWVSTPLWTIAVTQQDDTIVAIAPILRRRWLGQSWTAFRAWVKRAYPDAWQDHRLSTEKETHTDGTP